MCGVMAAPGTCDVDGQRDDFKVYGVRKVAECATLAGALILGVVGCVLVVGLVWWMVAAGRQRRRALKLALQVPSLRRKPVVGVRAASSRRRTDGIDDASGTQPIDAYVDGMLDLDEQRASLVTGCEIASFNDYLYSLHLSGGSRTAESMVLALAQSVAPTIALPLMMLLPQKWRSMPIFGRGIESKLSLLGGYESEAAGAGAPSKLSKQSAWFSPITAAFLTETLTQAMRNSTPRASWRPLLSLARGEPPGKSARAALKSTKLPNPFVLHSDVAPLVQAMLEEEPDEPSGPEEHRVMRTRPLNASLLPGLELGYGGLRAEHSRRQECLNRVLAILLNRLAVNGVRGASHVSLLHEHKIDLAALKADAELAREWNQLIDFDSPFGVQVGDSASDIVYTPHELVQYLLMGQTHESSSITPHRMQIQSQPTSFGIGLCVKMPAGHDAATSQASHSYVQIPLACAMKTGVCRVARNTDGDGEQVTTFLNHAGISLHIRSGVLPGYVQYYEGVEGFCGWHPENNPVKPWQIGERMAITLQVVSEGSVPGRQDLPAVMDVLKYCAVASVASCLSAVKQGLPMGGYGTNGVCIDSVAIVQIALGTLKNDEPSKGARTNLYPILLSGAGRQNMHASARSLLLAALDDHARTRGSENGCFFKQDAQTVMDAIEALPNDIAPSIGDVPGIMRRVLDNIPPNSPFAMVDATAADCRAVLAAL
ncbi:hypothetical protein FVE85_9640 [Porphyridium purpureum]|uniref:Uncharacterized protein n=1 Tax=Porphyridium purpureum TaxID=35688 RepID=A0A5J4YLR9_PORPP|nr:hypothetical protein FVE85_9640 [Porphyridium purpureum]|eukprot:POR6246..scf246_12